jgi:hypothetical protein
MTFTNVFGGTTIYPSDVSYRAITLSANTTLDWPLETVPNGNIVAQIMDVTATAASLVIRMPPANETGAGQTALFFNVGANAFVVANNGGSTIVSIPPGQAWQIYLTNSSTVNGTWRSFQYGAGTSSATAGSLIGAGIKAIGATLNQSMPVSSIGSNYTIGSVDRASAINWTGGAGTLSLSSANSVGSDWFVNVRNSGTGGITIQTSVGGQNINGLSSIFLNPADSAIVFSDGSNFFTIGIGQSVEFAFDYISIDLTSDASPYALSGNELNRVSYNFFGTLTGNMQVVVPATVQQYWISNGTDAASAAYTITVKTSAGSGVAIARNQRSILYCNGVDVVEADTGGISLPISVAQGGTGAITASAARTNLGATSLGSALFTSASATVARSDLGSTAVGDALFIASDAASGRSTLGLGSMAVINSPVPVVNGGTGVTTSTGTVAVVLSNSPTLVTPNLGTPSAATLTNATGLPLSTGVTGTLPVGNGGTGRAVGNYSVFSLEIHVSKDGNDTTGDGTLINPVLTIVKALTLVSAGRNTVLVHPGTYTENPTVSTTNVTIATSELTGANTQINGTLTLSAAARVSGLKMNNLTITGSGNTYISNCTVDTQVIKSGSNYVEIINSELQCSSGVQISGTGTVSIVGNKCWSVAVSNASAIVLIKDCFQVLTPSVTAGTLNFDGCAIFAASPATNAVTSSVGTFVTLANSFVLNSAGTSVERVSLAGSYSILNLVYDKTNSTFTGTNLNAIDYFSVVNADTLTLTNALAVANGGTGQTTYTNGQLLIGNTTGNTLTKATLTAGSGISITNGAGSITIAATGSGGTVTSVAGTGSVNGLTLTGTVTSSGNITLGGSVTSVATTATIDGVVIGYRNIPRSTTTTTAVVADVGKCIAVTAGITIPNSTFAAGDAVSIYNDSASAVTITAGVTTLRQAGTANTGNRTLAARGMATVWFNSPTEAIISGAGIS